MFYLWKERFEVIYTILKFQLWFWIVMINLWKWWFVSSEKIGKIEYNSIKIVWKIRNILYFLFFLASETILVSDGCFRFL